MAKKKKGMSPTVKAGTIIMFILALMWAVLTSEDAWYMKQSASVEKQIEIEPIDIVKEDKEVVKIIDKEEVIEAEKSEAEEKVKETEDVEEKVEAGKTDTFNGTQDLNKFDTKEISWSFKRNTEHQPTIGYNEGVDLAAFDAYYIVPTTDQVMYLTFDAGYENGYTASILDSLKKNNTQAAFFVTASYIKRNTDLVKRMKAEGHIVGNHSVQHKSTPTLTYDELAAELKGVEEVMETYTGYKLDLFFRPPMGTFSERSLYMTRQQGYKTIFWSMAYGDWKIDDQPGEEAAYNHVTSNSHPGAIILLHAVSKSNAEAMERILKELQRQGYRLGSLNELKSMYE